MWEQLVEGKRREERRTGSMKREIEVGSRRDKERDEERYRGRQ